MRCRDGNARHGAVAGRCDQGHTLGWPWLETETSIMTIGSARPLEDAARIAHRELVRWIDQETGMGQEEADMALKMAGKARLGNIVDPKYTIGTGIAKKHRAVTAL